MNPQDQERFLFMLAARWPDDIRGDAGTEIALKVLQGVDVRDINVHSIDRTEYFRPKVTY